MDAVVADLSMKYIPIFAYIHPNVITIFGLIINFVIYYGLVNQTISSLTLFILLMLRWLADTWDGAVARHYDKQSKLGGFLDTISDFIFFTSMFNYAVMQSGISYYFLYTIAFMAVYWYVIYYYDSLTDHSGLKNYEDSWMSFGNVMPFLVNNSVIPYLFVFFLISYLYEPGMSEMGPEITP